MKLTKERREELEREIADRPDFYRSGRPAKFEVDLRFLRALLAAAEMAEVLDAEVEAWRGYNQARMEAATRPRGIPGADQVVIAAAGTIVGQARSATDAAAARLGYTIGGKR